MSMLSALSELATKRKEIEEAARAQAKAIVAPALEEFMKEHSSIKAIGWSQYTPYFNDGEECTFSFHGLSASVSDERDDNIHGEGWNEIYGSKPDEGFSIPAWKALDELRKALDGAEPELKAAFGDHVRVIVTREGVDVESYEHE